MKWIFEKKWYFLISRRSFYKGVQGVGKIYHEVLILMNFLLTKPQIKNMYNNYYDLYCTVIKNRDEKQIVGDENKINENDYIILRISFLITILEEKIMLKN